MNSRHALFILGLCLVAAISALSSWLTLRFFSSSDSHSIAEYHQWIHDQLQMTAEQERLLLPSERRYEEARRHLEEVIRLANISLAENIRRDKSFSPDVEKSVAEIHDAMGRLQKATLEHIFEMEKVLEPDQYKRLMELTVEGLSENARQQ